VTFTILEIAERGASGIDLVALVDGGGHVILAVGAIIQTGVALLLAWGSHAVERIAAAFARTRPFRPRRRPAPLRRPCLVVRPAAGAPSGASAPRAPPAFA
jgi:hypothetical protein